jgi:hypothetical protein
MGRVLSGQRLRRDDRMNSVCSRREESRHPRSKGQHCVRIGQNSARPTSWDPTEKSCWLADSHQKIEKGFPELPSVLGSEQLGAVS